MIHLKRKSVWRKISLFPKQLMKQEILKTSKWLSQIHLFKCRLNSVHRSFQIPEITLVKRYFETISSSKYLHWLFIDHLKQRRIKGKKEKRQDATESERVKSLEWAAEEMSFLLCNCVLRLLYHPPSPYITTLELWDMWRTRERKEKHLQVIK